MKKISSLISAILFFSCALALANGPASIEGKVMDSKDGSPIGWTTVALLNADSTVVTATACSENGIFKMNATSGKYILKASMMGYKDYCTPVTLKEGSNTIPDIALTTDEQMLAAARITEHEKLLEIKIDKLVMNVSQSAFAQGSNALDLIKKAPGVTIDKDGNIKLNGKSVQVWIDGRPSHMSGKSLESLLRSTNGESIDKFELMEHPSAKYDAAGQGGIINIKTKRNFLTGFNGSMGLGGGGMYYSAYKSFPWQQSFWANLAYRTKKTNTFFSIYEGFYNNHVDFSNTQESSGKIQYSRSYLPDFYHNYNIKIGNDWFINKKNTLGFIIYIPGDYQTLNAPSTGYIEEGGIRTKTISSDIRNLNRSTKYNGNINFTHIFEESRSAELTVNLDYFRNIGKESNSQKDTTKTAASSITAEKNINADITYDVWSAKADYQTVLWKKFMMEAGAKWALSITDNVSKEKNDLLPDVNTVFTYREHIGAVYASLAGQLSEKWSIKGGLRGEYTNSFGDWISIKDQSRRSYFNVFPTAFIGFNPNEKWRFTLSYSRRINRPDYSQLNPTKTYLDAKTYIMGNPAISPEFSNNVTFMSGFGQHLSLSLGYSASKDALSQIPSYEKGVTILTWGNYGTNRVAYASFNVAALPITKWLQWTLSSTGLNINSTIKDINLTRNSLAFQGYTSFTFQLPKTWRIDLDAYYSSPMIYGQFRIHEHWGSNVAVKKTLLDGKMTLTLKLNDILRSSTMNIDILDDNGSGTTTRFAQRFTEQKAIIDITWNFGKAHQTPKRKVGNLEEMSRAGRSSLGGK